MKLKYIGLLSLVLAIVLVSTTAIAQEWFTLKEGPKEVSEEKEWVIKFDQVLAPETVNEEHIYVKNQETNQKHSINLEIREEGQVIVISPEKLYQSGETYELFISDGLKSEDGGALEKNTKKVFTIPEQFEVKNLNGDVVAKYDTYSEARSQVAEDGSQVISFGNNTIWAEDGIVHSDGYTIVYDSERLSSSITYVNTVGNGSVELEYVETHDEAIEVKVAGQTGFISHDSGDVVPYDQLGGRSVYEVVDRENENVLIHRVYENGKYQRYTYGWAPDWLEPGEYYSWDGITFDGQEHKLFNQLDIQKESNYTAEELNNFIKENSNHQNSFHFRTVEESPLAGLGGAFKEAEEKYGVNALYLMSLAIHESAWGTSTIAQDKNNLFGLNASDSAPYGNADEFESFEEAVLYAGYFISDNYLDPNDYRYEGPYAGNKAFGLNVRYASDPYWGQKIAGHMYRADRYLGGEDRDLLK